jgi:carbon storage regulator
MLVLSRKRDERIVIDGNIVVTVVYLDAQRVRLGIEAPTDVTVNREEIERLPPKTRRNARDGRPARIAAAGERKKSLVTTEVTATKARTR